MSMAAGMERAITSEAMKLLGLTAAAGVSVLVAVSSLRADSSEPDAVVPTIPSKPSAAISELRNQDSAFALLTEAFREIQTRLIQNDYEARVRAANALESLKTRRQVIVLAKQERDLRLQKLMLQLGNMNSGYDYARQVDEREVGVVVPSHVDTIEAANRLKTFVVLTPDSVENSAPAIPVCNFLLSSVPAD